MSNKKTTLKLFTIAQYQQEEEYLSSMHENGWKLSKITFPGIYHFEKCDPKKVTYRLDYNKDGIKHKSEYVKMFSDCGWDYLFDFVGYSYFCKESDNQPEKEEIFCDDASRLDMMKRVLKGRIYPLIILFLCVILPQFLEYTVGGGFGGGGPVQTILAVVFLLLIFLYLVLFGAMAYQFYQYEKKILPDTAGVKYKYAGIALLILLMTICTGSLFYVSNRSVYTVSERADGFTIEAENLNKSVEMEYNLKKGDKIEVSHEYEDGEIYISVGEENKEPIFYGNSYSEMDDFTLTIQEDGCYKIKCSGRRAKGVINFVIK